MPLVISSAPSWFLGYVDFFGFVELAILFHDINKLFQAGTAFNQFVDMGKKNMETAANIAKGEAKFVF